MTGNCSCVYVEPDTPIHCYEIKTPKARKVHTCCECGKEIEPGQEYEHVRGRWDGPDFETFKTCSVCLEIRDAFFCHGWYYSMMYEYLYEHLREGDVSEDCLVELSSEARGIVCGMIEDMWGEERI